MNSVSGTLNTTLIRIKLSLKGVLIRVKDFVYSNAFECRCSSLFLEQSLSFQFCLKASLRVIYILKVPRSNEFRTAKEPFLVS